MKPVLYVIMPTMPARKGNWLRLRENWEAVMEKGNQHVIMVWMPVLYYSEWESLSSDDIRVLTGTWISTLVTDPSKQEMLPVIDKINTGIDVVASRDSEAWVFPESDDNLVPLNLLEKLASVMDEQARVIIPSVARGQHQTKSEYPTESLIASPENMCVGACTSAFIHYGVLVNRRYFNSNLADGLMIEELHQTMPETFRYLPDVFTAFNALEPGRWDEEKLKDIVSK